MKTPWPHQLYAVAAVPQAIADGKRRICLTSPTGGGKTDMIMWIAEQFILAGKKAVIYTHRKLLIEQLYREFSAFGLDATVRAPGYDHDYFPLQIASLQTAGSRSLKRKTESLHRCDLAIFDECFVGETLVSTPQGERRIDSLRAGDPIYCATGFSWVQAVSRRRSINLFRLEFSDGRECVCTPNHPFFTARGWQYAGQLAKREIVLRAEDMSGLWGHFLTEALGPSRYGGDRVETADMLLDLLFKEAGEPDVRRRAQRKDAPEHLKAWAQAEVSGWQRQTAFDAAISLARSTRQWLETGIRSGDENEEAKGRDADKLQDRHSESKDDGGDRSGRRLTHGIEPKSGGCTQDGVTGFVRVERVSRLKRRSPTPVFNLQVAGHPSYFANGLLVHNCHVQTGPTAQAIMKSHLADGATILGVTATPLDLENLYEHLIVAGKNSELRDCGALVPAVHYGPDEPDMKAFAKELATGKDLSESKAERAMMVDGIFGRVVEWYRKLNPEQKPTILFAPSVGASLWFAQQFHAAGITAGHIDGEEVWINGVFQGAGGRERLAAGSADGTIKVVCNRFVLREGVNWPWLAHGILATVFGSLQSYLQSGGRLLRFFPGLGFVTIQDHGGNWWRHGSLNADRLWTLDLTASSVAMLRADAMRQHPEKQPVRCPKCGAILQKKLCPCGFEVHTRSRPVVQSDGTLREMKGDVFRPRPVAKWPTAENDWKNIFYRARNSKNKMTFFQAEALFAQEHHWNWPARSWRLMPFNDADMPRRVADVPFERLRM